eukprot:jgi/Mesen1/9622/ME000667S09276
MRPTGAAAGGGQDHQHPGWECLAVLAASLNCCNALYHMHGGKASKSDSLEGGAPVMVGEVARGSSVHAAECVM